GNAQLIVNGSISDFECAYARYVVGSGLFADELSVAISQTANFDYDARRVLTNSTYGTNNCAAAPSSTQQPGIYTPLSTSRESDVPARWSIWVGPPTSRRQQRMPLPCRPPSPSRRRPTP